MACLAAHLWTVSPCALLSPTSLPALCRQSRSGKLRAMRGAWVYILASKRNGTLYVGMTSDLQRRMEEHRQGLIEGFTKRYGVKRLVWAERHESIAAAVQREKTIKKYPRRWKLNLIESLNPQWRDLSENWDVFE